MTSRGEIKVMLNLCSRERNFVVGVKPRTQNFFSALLT